MRIITTQLGFFGPAKRVPSRPRAVSTLQPRISTRLLRRNPLRPTSVIGHSSLSNFTKETSRNFASASGELPETIDIIVLDPRLLFTPFGDPLDPTYSDYVVGPFPIPKQLLENGGLDNVMEELDSYQPMNSFYFGERSEEVGLEWRCRLFGSFSLYWILTMLRILDSCLSTRSWDNTRPSRTIPPSPSSLDWMSLGTRAWTGTVSKRSGAKPKPIAKT